MTTVGQHGSSGQVVGAPVSNEEGVVKAAAQIKQGALERSDFHVWYSRSADTVFVRFRASERRPSISYFMPSRPEILLRLDNETGVLTGIDFTHFREVLAKQEPLFAAIGHLMKIRRLWPWSPMRVPSASRPTIAREAADGVLRHCRPHNYWPERGTMRKVGD